MAKDKKDSKMEEQAESVVKTVSEVVVEEPTQEQAPAPVQESTPAESVKVEEPTQAVVEANPFQTQIEKITEGDSSLQILSARLQEYVNKMSPGIPVSDNSGALANLGLLKTITSVADSFDPKLFNKAWSIVLAYFDEYSDGVFSDRYAYRFPQAWGFGEDSLKAYQNLVDLCRHTANPNSRKAALKQIDFNKSLEYGITEEGRSKIVSYYK